MVLSNKRIEALIAANKLIIGADSTHIKNASYSISVGRIFSPETGEEIHLGLIKKKKSKHFVEIKPGEIIVVMSKERVKMPFNISASYNPTFATSKKGLSLINNSNIEPGYEGSLSCILANFSKSSAQIFLNEAIVKLVFYEVAPQETDIPSDTMKSEVISEEDYSRSVAQIASNFHRTFLDIKSLEERVVEKSITAVRRQVNISGIFIAILLLFATLQPFVSKWIYKNDIEDNYTLKGDLIYRIMRLEELDSVYSNKFRSIDDSLRRRK